MNSKRFEYLHKDIGYLKKDIIFRTIFAVVFLGIFVWQFSSMINVAFNGNLSIVQTAVSALVLLCSILLAFISTAYAFKDFRIISAIKMNGKCVSSVQTLINTKKTGFMSLYQTLLKILTLATTLVLIACITYTILEIKYLSTISFFLPFLLMVCASGYNSVYHIQDEIRVQNTLQEFLTY